VARRAPGDLLRSARGHDVPAGRAALGPEVDQPIRRLEDVKVVLDHDDGVTAGPEAEEDLEQSVDVGEVETGRRLVEEEEGLAGRGSGELERDLDPLGLPARKGRRALAELHVAETDVLQELEAMLDPSVIPEEVERLVDRHVEDVRDRLAFELHLEGLGVEPLAAALLARDVHVG